MMQKTTLISNLLPTKNDKGLWQKTTDLTVHLECLLR